MGGPTATGKTALSVFLAQRFSGEIISADSMQIYRGLDIGTAKATEEERGGIRHLLIDCCTPDQTFSAADFTQAAAQEIRRITAEGKLAFVVGGTGLYISSLLNGIRFTPEKTDLQLRAKLEERAAAGENLYAELAEIDPAYAETVHPNNLPRILRALELYESTGRTMTQQRLHSRPEQPPYRALCLCLGFEDRSLLYRRIDRRVDCMVEQGIVGEAEQVYLHRSEYRTAAQAIGYKEFFPYFEGSATLQECVAALKKASRNYAKRQMTWFRHQTSAVWLDAAAPDLREKAGLLVEEFLRKG
jgi:tRNA dimethylallyltransferase